jgi:hypothetical protein
MANSAAYLGTPALYADLPPGNTNGTGTAGTIVTINDYQAKFKEPLNKYHHSQIF